MCELSTLPSIEVEDEGMKRSQKARNIIRQISVEPLLLCGSLFILLYSIVADQYIFYRVSKQHGLSPDNISSPECGANSTDAVYDQVSNESSQWILYCNIAGFITSFFFTVMVSAWGDEVGRKPPLICVFIGFLVLIIIHIVVVHCDLDVAWLLAARVLCGFGGDYSALLACSFAYLSDVSSHKGRTLRLALGEACLGVGGIVGTVISGPWIDAKGFESPLWLLFALVIACFLYIIFVLKESVEVVNDNSNSLVWRFKGLINCTPYRSVWTYLRRRENHIYISVGVLFCLFLQLVTYDGMLDTITVYEKSPPLCWPSTYVGYAQAIFVSNSIIGLIAMKIMEKKVSEMILLSVGVVSEMICLLFFTLSTTTWSLFLGLVLGCLSSIPVVIMRSTLSRLTIIQDQGSVFALTALAQSIAGLVGSFIFNGVYSATVSTYQQAIFVIGIFIYCSVLIIFCLMKRLTKLNSMMKENDYGSLEESDA